MSLIASGIPHSAGASPWARRRSASRACASACSWQIVMKALSRGSTALMRSRQARVSSVADSSRLRSRCCAWAIVSLQASVVTSLNDLGYLEHLLAGGGCVGQNRGRVFAVGYRVLAHRGADLADLRGGLDGAGVKLVEFVDVLQHLFEVAQHPLFFLRRQFQPRQQRDMPDLFEVYLVTAFICCHFKCVRDTSV